MHLAVSTKDATSLSMSLPPFSLTLSGEITVPMATQQIAWRLLWLWAPWQRILYAGGSLSPSLFHTHPLTFILSVGSLGLYVPSCVRNQHRLP